MKERFVLLWELFLDQFTVLHHVHCRLRLKYPRRPKQKTKLQLAEEKYARQGKKPKLVAKPDPTFQKKLVVFKYMGQDAPAHFTRKDD